MCVRGRARACPGFNVADRRGATSDPTRRGCAARSVRSQLVAHDLADNSWAGALAAVSALADDQLDSRVMSWRLHVFTPVDGMPGAAGMGTVAVLQATHALGDGIRCSALAAQLFGRAGAVPAVPTPPPFRGAALPWRAVRATRAHRQLVRDTADRSCSGAGGIASGAAHQHAAGGHPKCPHRDPAPRPAARADSDDRRAGRVVHRPVRSSAWAR